MSSASRDGKFHLGCRRLVSWPVERTIEANHRRATYTCDSSCQWTLQIILTYYFNFNRDLVGPAGSEVHVSFVLRVISFNAFLLQFPTTMTVLYCFRLQSSPKAPLPVNPSTAFKGLNSLGHLYFITPHISDAGNLRWLGGNPPCGKGYKRNFVCAHNRFDRGWASLVMVTMSLVSWVCPATPC